MVELEIVNQKDDYSPGDIIECEYRIAPEGQKRIQAIETSVLWYTQGKGDEDLGVHFFKRRLRREMAENELEKVHRLSVQLPRSPLSYSGAILQIQWCVRVCLFFKKGGPETFEREFQLGDMMRSVNAIVPENNDDSHTQ